MSIAGLMGYYAAAQKLWTPADHTTAPRFWAEIHEPADYLLNGGGDLNRVYDKSGNGFDLVRDPGYNPVDYEVARNCAKSRASSYLVTPGNPISGTTGGWVGCFVYEGNGAAINTGGSGFPSNNIGINWGHSTTRQMYLGVHGWGSGGWTSNGGTAGQWATYGHERRYSTGQRYNCNGGTKVSIGHATQSLNGRDWRVFCDTAGGGFQANQRFKAVCYFMEDDYDGTNGTLAKLEGYFAHKFGFASQLVSGHPYKNNPPYL